MSSFVLKILAIIFMTIDHLFKVAPQAVSHLPHFLIPIPGGSLAFPGAISLLGRIAFPIFAFCVAEGASHTKNIENYLRRLFLFAIISEIPFDYMFFGKLTYAYQNVIWTFFFGVLAIHVYRKLNTTKIIALFTVFSIYLASCFCKTDYYSIGVILIFVMFVIKNKPIKLFAAAGIIIAYYLYSKGLLSAISASNTSLILNISLSLCATLFSIVIIACYNGKKGMGMKWFFYIYYPAHLILLGMLDKLC